jgi:hypothetical protein
MIIRSFGEYSSQNELFSPNVLFFRRNPGKRENSLCHLPFLSPEPLIREPLLLIESDID